MMEYLAAAGDGMVNVLTWPNILYPVVGTLAAMMTSFLPGANGLTLMAVALPLTLDAWRGRHYFRAERIDPAGALIRLDLCYE